MRFVNPFKIFTAIFKSKRQDGIYCLSQEQDVGTAAPVVLGANGGLRPSAAFATVSQITPEESDLTLKLFGGDQSRIQELLDAVQAARPVHCDAPVTRHRTEPDE